MNWKLNNYYRGFFFFEIIIFRFLSIDVEIRIFYIFRCSRASFNLILMLFDVFFLIDDVCGTFLPYLENLEVWSVKFSIPRLGIFTRIFCVTSSLLFFILTKLCPRKVFQIHLRCKLIIYIKLKKNNINPIVFQFRFRFFLFFYYESLQNCKLNFSSLEIYIDHPQYGLISARYHYLISSWIIWKLLFNYIRIIWKISFGDKILNLVKRYLSEVSPVRV